MVQKRWQLDREQYYIKHRDERLKYQHKYYQEHKEKINIQNREYSKNYAKSHPEVNRRADNRRFKKEQKLLIKLKLNGCAICGYNKCNRALHFHHANPEDKKFQIVAHCLRRKDTLIIDELNKCILLCANCHSEITAKDVGDYLDY